METIMIEAHTMQELKRKAKILAVENKPAYKGKHLKVFTHPVMAEEDCFDVVVYTRKGKVVLYCVASVKEIAKATA